MVRLLPVLAATAAHVAMAGSPLAKVVTLLQNMGKEINKEMEQDAAISKKMQCWCTSNRKEKTEAIAAAEAEIKETEALIESLTAKAGALEVNVKKLTKDLASQEKELKALEKQREKEAAEFRKYETDTTKAVQQLKGAITILSKHNGLLQQSQVAEIRGILTKAGSALASAIQSTSALSLLDTSVSPYAAQSGQIFGILTQMMEQMDKDLVEAQQNEAAAVKEFGAMRKAKRDQIAATRTELGKTKDVLARTQEDLSRAKKSVKETKEQLESDRKFLADLEVRCAADKKEHAARMKDQTDELQAINETLDILTSDEARDQLNKTLKPSSFLQLTSNTRQRLTNKSRAAALLKKTAMVHDSAELGLMATRVQLDAFEEVKTMIANLVKELKQKKADEVVKRDYCISSLDENDKASFDASTKAEELNGKKTELEGTIEQLNKQLEATKTNIENLKIEIATATQTRQEENAAYQTVYADQSITKDILQKAIAKLRSFYDAKAAGNTKTLLELSLEAEQPGGPVGLSKGGYKKKNGGGVIGMIEMIIADSDKTVAESLADEKNAQAAYEKFLGDSRENMGLLQKKQTTIEENTATSEADLIAVKQDQKSNLRHLEDLESQKNDLHTECDFLMQNFESRQTGYDQEVEALNEAVGILSGAQ